MRTLLSFTLATSLLAGLGSQVHAAQSRQEIDLLISAHAKANGIPESLVHRVVRGESGYNPAASNRGNLGLMQIRYATARGLGYTGDPQGLFDANTNLTYAVLYLANAYRVADGNIDRAVGYYRSGYYYAAKRKGLIGDKGSLLSHRPAQVQEAPARVQEAMAAPVPSPTVETDGSR